MAVQTDQPCPRMLEKKDTFLLQNWRGGVLKAQAIELEIIAGDRSAEVRGAIGW